MEWMISGNNIVEKGNGIFEITDVDGNKSNITATHAAGAAVDVIQDVDNQALAINFLSLVLSDRTKHGEELHEIPLAGLAATLQAIGARIEDVIVGAKTEIDVLRKMAGMLEK